METTLDNDVLHIESEHASLDLELWCTTKNTSIKDVSMDATVFLKHGTGSVIKNVMNVFDEAIQRLGTQEVQVFFQSNLRAGVNMFSSLRDSLSGQRSSIKVQANPPFVPTVSFTTTPSSSASAAQTSIHIKFSGPGTREFTENNGENIMLHVVGGLADMPIFVRLRATSDSRTAESGIPTHERTGTERNEFTFSEDVLALANMPLPVLVNTVQQDYKKNALCEVWVARGEVLIESGRLAWSGRNAFQERASNIHNVGYRAEDIGHVMLDGTLCFYKDVALQELCKAVILSELNAVIPNTTRVHEFAAIRPEGMTNAEYIEGCKRQNNAVQGIMVSEIAGVPLRVFLRKHARKNVLVSILRQFLWTAYCIMCWTGTYHDDADIRNIMVASSDDARLRTLTYHVGNDDRVEIDIHFGGLTVIMKLIDVGSGCFTDKTVHRNVERLRAGRVGEAVNLLNEGYSPDGLFWSIKTFLSQLIDKLNEPDMLNNTAWKEITPRLEACRRAALDMSKSSDSSSALHDVHTLDRLLTHGVQMTNTPRSRSSRASPSRRASRSTTRSAVQGQQHSRASRSRPSVETGRRRKPKETSK
jgi:hypothetical protein